MIPVLPVLSSGAFVVRALALAALALRGAQARSAGQGSRSGSGSRLVSCLSRPTVHCACWACVVSGTRLLAAEEWWLVMGCQMKETVRAEAI